MANTELYWTERCKHCDIFRDKPHDQCVNRIKPHDKRKKGKHCFVCSSISFCEKKEVKP